MKRRLVSRFNSSFIIHLNKSHYVVENLLSLPRWFQAGRNCGNHSDEEDETEEQFSLSEIPRF